MEITFSSTSSPPLPRVLIWHGSMSLRLHLLITQGRDLICLRRLLSIMRGIPLVIIGAGGFARELYSWAAYEPNCQVSAFLDERRVQPEIFGIPVFKDFSNSMRGKRFLVAVGDPLQRERLWEKALAAGMIPAQSLIHRSVIAGIEVYSSVGCIVCPGVVLTTNIRMGKGTIININATVGHDCVLGKFVTISPGANISGNCSIGDRSYIGTNSCMREKITIGNDSTLGMGSVLLKAIPDGEVWVGNPAKKLIKSGLSTH